MVLHFIDKGTGQPILLLHGMASSYRYWESYIDTLAKTNRVIAVDLLGFGRSPKPKISYTPQDHAAAIEETLNHLSIKEPVTIIAHSMGALIALNLALNDQKRVKKLILIGMPIYTTPEEARKDITKSKKTLKWTYYGLTSHIICTTWCYLLRPISKRVAHLYLKKWPKKVAEDSVLHTWRSYSESLKNVIENQHVELDLQKLKVPTLLLYGDKDVATVLKNVKGLKNLPANITLQFLPGTHNLPLEQAKTVMESLNK
jgi:cis-3-alkyl-4-acyloxetan-2-one decarboxylase